MPFTLSHPAAAVPLARFGLPMSALVVGSMAPDFPYFLYLSATKQYAHTVPGLFVFCIPAGLVVLWAFHVVLKHPLLSLLPEAHRSRLNGVTGGFHFGPVRRFVLILLSLLLGAVSHLVWDSFTHEAGWTVQHAPVLSMTVLYTSNGALHLYKLLQHASTVVGACLLIYWYALWFRKAALVRPNKSIQFSEPVRISLVAGMALLAAFVGLTYSWLVRHSAAGESSLRGFTFHFIVAGAAILAFELIIYSIGWHVYLRRKRSQ